MELSRLSEHARRICLSLIRGAGDLITNPADQLRAGLLKLQRIGLTPRPGSLQPLSKHLPLGGGQGPRPLREPAR